MRSRTPVSAPVHAAAGSDATPLELIGSQQLVVERGALADTLRLYGGDGRLTLTVRVTPDGPVLLVEGGGLAIRAEGALAIDAQHVAIRGREGVVVQSGADLCVGAAGSLDLTARRQQLTARGGDVRVYASDDVVLDGERVRMNC